MEWPARLPPVVGGGVSEKFWMNSRIVSFSGMMGETISNPTRHIMVQKLLPHSHRDGMY